MAICHPILGRSQLRSPVLLYGLSKFLELCKWQVNSRHSILIWSVFTSSLKDLKRFVLTVANLSLTNMCRCRSVHITFHVNASPWSLAELNPCVTHSFLTSVCKLESSVNYMIRNISLRVYGRIMALAFTVSDCI